MCSVWSFVHPPALLFTARSHGRPSLLPWDCWHFLAWNRPPLLLLLPVGCCLSISPVDGGIWGNCLPLLFSGLIPLPLVVAQKIRHWDGRVAAAATAIHVLATSQFWPSPSPRTCTSKVSPGRGRRVGIVSFVVISIACVMVMRVIWTVSGRFYCRAYVQSGRNV